MYELAYRGGDFIGTKIYASSAEHGFLYCMLAGTATSALMLAVLRLIPRELVATADGERNPKVEEELLAEISPAVSASGAARR